MADNVLPFEKPEKADPYMTGPAKCIGCQHTWVSVAPIGTQWLECPGCGTMRGTWVLPVGAQEGDEFFSCRCGSEAMTAYKRLGKFWLRCMSCGLDQTEAIFG